jgi:hypothetical protein
MVQKITRIRFTVHKSIELENGIMLRHGAYWGVMEKDRLEGDTGQEDWGKPRYYLELSPEQMERMGQPAYLRRQLTCDLTTLVEDGVIEALEMA